MGVETSDRDRSFSSEPICSLSSFQNGDIKINQTCSSERRLDNIFGSERCLFSNSDSSQVSAISSLLLRRESVLVPSFTSVSPYIFTRVLKTVLIYIRRQDIRVHAYLDDWLQPSIRETLSWLHSRRLLRIVLDLGFIPNWEKSELVPVQKFGFLGARFHLDSAQIGPSLDRILSFRNVLRVA